MPAYFHNIGKPEHPATWQSLWDSLRSTGIITAGYGNQPGGRGQQVLSRYGPGDIIFAYANGFGVIGCGTAEGRDSHRLVEQARHGSNHRHEAAVQWEFAATDINDGLPPHAVRQITHHLPRQTSEKVFIEAERLKLELSRRWPRVGVTRSHVIAAFEQIGAEGYASERESTIWDVIEPVTGRRYPPKVILKRAAELAGFNQRSKYNRGGGWPTNQILEGVGFIVVPKQGEMLRAEQECGQLGIEALRARAERDENQRPQRTPVLGAYIPRSAAISAYAKRLAKGVCDLCGQPAPFRTAAGPYLECHHIDRLADGGPDCIQNVVALCPNCHRRMHYAEDRTDKMTLLKRVAKRDEIASRRTILPERNPISE